MRALPLAAAVLSLAVHARAAAACAPAAPPGVFVQVAEESALIVWDDQAKREHFIRRASFLGAEKDFGFLVPTPDKPELAEAGDEVFSRLEQATKPEVVYDTSIAGVEPTSVCAGLFLLRAGKAVPAQAAAAAAAPVRVLDAQRVAGYDAVVLEADDPRALADWLKDHGYASRPALAEWLAPYVSAKWKLTAFKITGGEGPVGTSAVRMSFATDRPFFPYREPSDQRRNVPAGAPQERLLRVFFVGPRRVEGAIGGEKAPWPGKALWSDRIEAARDLGALPVAAPAGAWLTMFEDRASPRPGTDDLFFTPSAETRPIKPPPVIVDQRRKVPLPLDLIGGAALVGGLVLRRRRRKAAPATP